MPLNTLASSTRNRYGPVAQSFHWLTVILVIAAFTLGPGGSESHVYATARDSTRQWHETLGLSVALLTLVRLAWRAWDVDPVEPPMPAIMHYAAKIMHVTLYVLLLALPLTAILGAWLEGHPLTPLVVGDIPSPFRLAHDTGQTLALVHTYLGDTIIWLAGLHAAAGLFHHFFLHDHILRSMLPKMD